MAAQQQISTQYLKNKIESATPIQRVIIMCEACQKFLTQSREALLRGDKLVFVDKNIKAQNIVREFRNSLNLEIDEKIASGFYSLYNFWLKQLMQAVRHRKVDYIDVVASDLKKVTEAWKTADRQGLGKDIPRFEQRKAGCATSKVRVSTASSYNQLNEGLNLMS